MNTGIIAELKKNSVVWRGIIISLIILALVIVYFIIVSLTPRTHYQLTPLGTSTQTGVSRLYGDDLYSFNGAAFTATNITSDDAPRILHSGLKLPNASLVRWAGERGALMQFSSGFTYTEVERYLEQNDMDIMSDYSGYVWYVDFADSSLHLVTTEPLLSDQIHYSEAAGSFYMALQTSADRPHNLALYSTDTKSLDFVESLPPLATVSSISGCFEDRSVCVNATGAMQSDQPTIYRLNPDSDGAPKLISSSGVILPTSHPDIYIVRDQVDNPESDKAPTIHDDHQHSVDIDFTLAPARLYNLQTKKYQPAGADIQGDDIMALVSQSSKDIAYLSQGGGDRYVSRAKTIFGTYANSQHTLSFASDNQFPNVLIPLSYGSDDSLLVSDASTQLHIISPEGEVKNSFARTTPAQANAALEACRPAGITDFELNDDARQVQIFVTADENFLDSVKRVGDCLADQPRLQWSYTFNYRGVSTENGRVII